jgi:hypothetical protein
MQAELRVEAGALLAFNTTAAASLTDASNLVVRPSLVLQGGRLVKEASASSTATIDIDVAAQAVSEIECRFATLTLSRGGSLSGTALRTLNGTTISLINNDFFFTGNSSFEGEGVIQTTGARMMLDGVVFRNRTREFRVNGVTLQLERNSFASGDSPVELLAGTVDTSCFDTVFLRSVSAAARCRARGAHASGCCSGLQAPSRARAT